MRVCRCQQLFKIGSPNIALAFIGCASTCVLDVTNFAQYLPTPHESSGKNDATNFLKISPVNVEGVVSKCVHMEQSEAMPHIATTLNGLLHAYRPCARVSPRILRHWGTRQLHAHPHSAHLVLLGLAKIVAFRASTNSLSTFHLGAPNDPSTHAWCVSVSGSNVSRGRIRARVPGLCSTGGSVCSCGSRLCAARRRRRLLPRRILLLPAEASPVSLHQHHHARGQPPCWRCVRAALRAQVPRLLAAHPGQPPPRGRGRAAVPGPRREPVGSVLVRLVVFSPRNTAPEGITVLFGWLQGCGFEPLEGVAVCCVGCSLGAVSAVLDKRLC